MIFVYVSAWLVVCLSIYVSGIQGKCNEISEESFQIMADIMKDKQITTIEGECTPLYRIDLPDDTIAYYVVHVNKEEHFIMSAGEKTCGDNKKLVTRDETSKRSPIDIIAEAAKKAGKRCHRYIVLGDVIEMICRDEEGKIVGTNFGETEIKEIVNRHGSLDGWVSAHKNDMVSSWKERCQDYTEDGQGDPGMGMDAMTIEAISPGETKDILFQGAVKKIYVQYIAMDPNETDEAKAATLKHLCEEIEGCTIEDDIGVISPSQYPPDSVRYQLKVSDKARESIMFKVTVEHKDAEKSESHFEIMQQPEGEEMTFEEFGKEEQHSEL